MPALTAALNLPFKPAENTEDNDCANNIEGCALYRMLPVNAKEYVKKAPHLLEYLHLFPVDEYGIPLFFSELKRDLKSMTDPNLIYPADETVFVHIFFDPNDVRNYYIPVDPSFMHSVKELLPAVEIKLVDLLDALEEDPVTDEERAEVLKRLISQVLYVRNPGEAVPALTGKTEQKGFGAKLKDFLNRDLTARANPHRASILASVPQTPDGRIIVTPQEYRAIEYMIIRDKIDVGLLKPFINDRYIEDITVDGVGPIFVEHKIFKGLKSVVGWDNTEDLDNFVIKLAERTKRPITYRNPIVDATLPDGSRINIVYSTDISRKGSNFTIRKAMDDPISILKLIEFKTCDYMVAAYLWICIENGMSLFMSGETASGKTTSLNALTTFIPPENKIVTIEDTPELQVPHKNWTREVSKGKGKGEGEGSDVTMFDPPQGSTPSAPEPDPRRRDPWCRGLRRVRCHADRSPRPLDVPRSFRRKAHPASLRGPDQHPQDVRRQPQHRRDPERGQEAYRRDRAPDAERQRARRVQSRDAGVLVRRDVPLGPGHGHPRVYGQGEQLPAREQDSNDARYTRA